MSIHTFNVRYWSTFSYRYSPSAVSCFVHSPGASIAADCFSSGTSFAWAANALNDPTIIQGPTIQCAAYAQQDNAEWASEAFS